MKAVVFLGPTLQQSEAEGVLDATYLPPARQGSVISALQAHRPDVIALVDGVFLQDLSVWHKEILFALENGVTVCGSSSMGALRAAELAPFGMIGVGHVFDQFARGVLQDDDEVALVHGPLEQQYRKLSEPMVNIRATLAAAVRAGRLADELCTLVLGCAKTLYFQERSISRICSELEGRGATPDSLALVHDVLRNHYVDVKRDDALLLLHAIKDGLPAAAAPVRMNRTMYFDLLYHRDRAGIHDGVALPISVAARYAALHEPDFETVRAHALNRTLVCTFARVLGIAPADIDIEREARAFRAAHRLLDDTALAAWLQRNDLSSGDFSELMHDLATCRALHRWWLSQARRRADKTRVVMDEYRLMNRYAAVCSRAVAYERAVVPGADDEDTCESLEQLFLAHARATGLLLRPPLAAWADEAGFLSLEDLRRELVRAAKRRETPAR